MTMTTIGLDLAKYVFQVHGVDAEGNVVEKRRLRRSQVIAYFASIPPCLVGMEACATAHFWGRELSRLGHEVRLMPPQYVKAYLKRGKNDAADAAAICEAVGRPSMRFVPIKTEEQQAVLVMHRARDLLVKQRTQLINAFRGHAAEFGIIGAQVTAGQPPRRSRPRRRPLECHLPPGHYPRRPGPAGAGPRNRRDASLTIGCHHRTDQRDRCPYHCLAQGKPRQSASGDDPRDWSSHRHGYCCHRG
jgi:transposase